MIIVWIAMVLLVTANWWSRIRNLDALEVATKPAATVALATLALVVSDGEPGVARAAAMAGFLACLAGDVALLPQVNRFLVGLGSFLVGHVCFVVMFASLGFDRAELGLVALVLIAGLAATIGLRIVRAARRQSAGFAVPVIAYLGVIGVMMIAGWSTGIVAACVGTALFVVSDSVLGWRKFVGERRWMSLMVMATYHGALLGIALSLA